VARPIGATEAEKESGFVVSATEVLGKATETLDVRLGVTEHLSRYYAGQQGNTFLSETARKAIGDRMRALPVNLVRTAADTLADRLSVQGFNVADDAALGARAWALWRASRMVTGHAHAHLDSLLLGCGYVSVWTAPDGSPRIRTESPRQTVVNLDPVTGEPTSAVKRWWAAKHGHAVVFEPDKVTRLRTSSEIARESGLPADGWSVVQTMDNALRDVPVTALPNRPRTDAPLGESEVLDALPLVDALSKLTQDMVVVSEAHSRPRRWVAGLEVVEEPRRDADGQPVLDADGEPVLDPVNPFSESPERVWQSEDPETRFGEFPASSLQSFVEGTNVLLRQIAAVTAVPPSVLGLSQDAPASAEALRASEVALVARARARQTVLGECWARVMRQALIVRDGVERPAFAEVAPVWADPEARSEIVAADRASKLKALGVPLAAILDDLGWAPDRIAAVLDARRAEALDAAAFDLSRVLP
jgi:hypothetical protein